MLVPAHPIPSICNSTAASLLLKTGCIKKKASHFDLSVSGIEN